MSDLTEPMPDPMWGEEVAAPADLGWDQSHALERRPQGLDSDSQLANHVYTISFTPKGQPMIVVRANRAVDITACFEELDAEGVYGQLAHAQQKLQQAAPPAEMIMQQLGATVMPPPQQPMGSPMAQQLAQAYPTPPNGFGGPPMPSPGQPPFGAPPGGYQMPQPGWGGGANQPPPRPQGWFAVKIPFNQMEEGKQVREWLKSQRLGSEMKFEKETKTWLVSPQVVEWFKRWNPSSA